MRFIVSSLLSISSMLLFVVASMFFTISTILFNAGEHSLTIIVCACLSCPVSMAVNARLAISIQSLKAVSYCAARPSSSPCVFLKSEICSGIAFSESSIFAFMVARFVWSSVISISLRSRAAMFALILHVLTAESAASSSLMSVFMPLFCCRIPKTPATVMTADIKMMAANMPIKYFLSFTLLNIFIFSFTCNVPFIP